ncbi:MAG: hypothetical protein JJU36_16350 [Phycisphaeraceae bacterium]|nr:hypothetical protein [Phycisphaeraceae bacterium]
MMNQSQGVVARMLCLWLLLSAAVSPVRADEVPEPNRIEPPATGHFGPAPDGRVSISLAITHEGQLFRSVFPGQFEPTVSTTDLGVLNRIGHATQGGDASPGPVYLMADRRATFGQMRPWLDLLHAHGLRTLVLVVDADAQEVRPAGQAQVENARPFNIGGIHRMIEPRVWVHLDEQGRTSLRTQSDDAEKQNIEIRALSGDALIEAMTRAMKEHRQPNAALMIDPKAGYSGLIQVLSLLHSHQVDQLLLNGRGFDLYIVSRSGVPESEPIPEAWLPDRDALLGMIQTQLGNWERVHRVRLQMLELLEVNRGLLDVRPAELPLRIDANRIVEVDRAAIPAIVREIDRNVARHWRDIHNMHMALLSQSPVSEVSLRLEDSLAKDAVVVLRDDHAFSAVDEPLDRTRLLAEAAASALQQAQQVIRLRAKDQGQPPPKRDEPDDPLGGFIGPALELDVPQVQIVDTLRGKSEGWPLWGQVVPNLSRPDALPDREWMSIDLWHILGPLPAPREVGDRRNAERLMTSMMMGPLSVRERLVDRLGRSVGWNEVRIDPRTRDAKIRPPVSSKGGVYLAMTTIDSAIDQEVWLVAGIAGTGGIWIGDEQTLETPDTARPFREDEYIQMVQLRQGLNTIRIRWTSTEDDTGFSLRIRGSQE